MSRVRVGTALAGVAAAVLVAVVTVNTTSWIGRPFPGFFVISNRVVASVTLPWWAGGEAPRFFQHQVVTVDGAPPLSADALYAYVRERPPGTPTSYTFRSMRGDELTAVVPSQPFTLRDYLLFFGMYLVTAVTFFATGLTTFALKRTSASLGLLAVTFTIGTFAITGCDLYGPHWFVRLHVLAESMLGATAIHLATVFPIERLGRRRRPFLAGLYLLFASFAGLYELALDDPARYTVMHLLASSTHGIGALAIIGVSGRELLASRSALAKRKVAVVAIGTLGAFVLPAVLMVASAFLGGTVPLNAAALTAFLFPLSVGWAILQQDLFEIDRVVRRAVTYAVVIVVLGAAYFATVALLGSFLHRDGSLASSPMTITALNLVLVFLVAPIRDRVQTAVDRLFFRQAYDSRSELSQLTHVLISAHTEPQVLEEVKAALARTVSPKVFVPLRLETVGTLTLLRTAGDPGAALPAQSIGERLGRGELLARYEWEDGRGGDEPRVWQALGVDLLVPVPATDEQQVVLALGQRESGRVYTVFDAEFLRAMAGQVALALTNARAFDRLEQLNASLELQVAERTASLADTNLSLGSSLEELRRAYEQLERNQASLVRSQRLATLGRLAAGIAHEVNTPLGAVVNSLKLLHDLGNEYEQSIDNPIVAPDDHRSIAREIIERAGSALGWARKAGAFINRMRIQSRDLRSNPSGTFSAVDLLADVQALLAHRARLSGSHIEFIGTEGVTLTGDPATLGQVLVNLVQNAIDAYEDSGRGEGRVEVRVERDPSAATLTVRDRAGGIPPDVLPHIFDELFTTKDPGRGTGLGLWIARNLIEQSFGGTLDVEVEPGVGSSFRIVLPTAAA